MTGRLSTHVLDTALGRPARGVTVELHRMGQGGDRHHVTTTITNPDGRTDRPLLSEDEFVPATYELVFDVTAYLAGTIADPSATPFLDRIPIRVTLVDDQAYHVPLLFSPWSYATYRGS